MDFACQACQCANLAGTRRSGQRTLRLDTPVGQGQSALSRCRRSSYTARAIPHKPLSYLLNFSSGAKIAKSPLYGCELWVHKTLPVYHDAAGHPIRLGGFHFTLQHADPRRLFVQAQLGKISYQFVVLHAPVLVVRLTTTFHPLNTFTHGGKKTMSCTPDLYR